MHESCIYIPWSMCFVLGSTVQNICNRSLSTVCSPTQTSRNNTQHIVLGECFVSDASNQVWSAEDLKCKRTIRSDFTVRLLMISARGRYIFCAGQTAASRGVIAVWHGHPDQKPLRLLEGHGKSIRSLYAPDNPGKICSLLRLTATWPMPLRFKVLYSRRHQLLTVQRCTLLITVYHCIGHPYTEYEKVLWCGLLFRDCMRLMGRRW